MDSELEKQASERGFRCIAGVDEAGRGPLAGPVVAAACVLLRPIEGINDSKKLTPAKRAHLYHELTTCQDVHWAVGIASAAEIDKLNILQATFQAMLRAIERLDCPVDYLLIDGNQMPAQIPVCAQAVVKGDARSISIAAASILAKETRDKMMEKYDLEFPNYGFAKHKGYPTQSHLNALKSYGPCSIHRLTFAPLKNLTNEKDRAIL